MTTTRITNPDGSQYDVTYTLTPAVMTPAYVKPAELFPAVVQTPEQLVIVSAVPAGVTPPILPPTTLTPSDSITVTADNQVVENKLVTGFINLSGRSGVIIRNCYIKHPGGIGIDAQSCTNLTIEDVKIVNTSAPVGQKPNLDETKNIQLYYGGPYTIRRVYVEGACGMYAYKTGPLNISFFEGHNVRGPVSPPRGQLIQLNQCSASLTVIEDFSCENDPNNSWPEDIISVYQCGTSKVQIRRGLIDGCNSPSGVGVMIENGTIGAVIEDVDVKRHGNGAFSFYDSSNNGRFTRCRMRDQISTNQGRGVPLSGSSGQACNLVAHPTTVAGARFEAIKYFNVSTNLTWFSPSTFSDLASQDFTLRAPIRNKFAWAP